MILAIPAGRCAHPGSLNLCFVLNDNVSTRGCATPVLGRSTLQEIIGVHDFGNTRGEVRCIPV